MAKTGAQRQREWRQRQKDRQPGCPYGDEDWHSQAVRAMAAAAKLEQLKAQGWVTARQEDCRPPA
jgi:hypothetical protein